MGAENNCVTLTDRERHEHSVNSYIDLFLSAIFAQKLMDVEQAYHAKEFPPCTQSAKVIQIKITNFLK